jgi:hypothetical protein
MTRELTRSIIRMRLRVAWAVIETGLKLKYAGEPNAYKLLTGLMEHKWRRAVMIGYVEFFLKG